MKRVIKGLVLTAIGVTSLTSCVDNTWKSYNTPSKFLSRCTVYLNCSIISSTYKDKEYPPDYEWTIKDAIEEVDNFNKVKDVTKTKRYMSYRLYQKNRGRSTDYYYVYLTIYENGYLTIKCPKRFGGHYYFHYQFNKDSAVSIIDKADAYVLYAEEAKNQAIEQAKIDGAISNYFLAKEPQLPINFKYYQSNKEYDLVDNGDLFNVLKNTSYTLITEKMSPIYDMSIWHSSDYYNNNPLWMLYYNKSAQVVECYYEFKDAVGRLLNNSLFYSISSTEAQQILLKAQEYIVNS